MALKHKYDELERELIEKRQTSRKEIAEFMEDNVLVKWTELRNLRRRIETKANFSHQVRC